MGDYAHMGTLPVVLSSVFLILCGLGTITLQILAIIEDPDIVWSQVGMGIWSGAAVILPAILGLIPGSVSMCRSISMIVFGLLALAAAVGSAVTVAAAGQMEDLGCPKTAFCDYYSYLFLIIGVVNVLEVPFIFMLLIAGGCCGKPKKKPAPLPPPPIQPQVVVAPQQASTPQPIVNDGHALAAVGVAATVAAVAENQQEDQHHLQNQHSVGTALGIDPIPESVIDEPHEIPAQYAGVGGPMIPVRASYKRVQPRPGEFASYLSEQDRVELGRNASALAGFEVSRGQSVKRTTSYADDDVFPQQQQLQQQQSTTPFVQPQTAAVVARAATVAAVSNNQQQQQAAGVATTTQAQPQQQQQPENRAAALGKAALSGAFGATMLGQIMEEEGDGKKKEETTVGEELVGNLAGVAAEAGIEALKSGEFELGGDGALAGAIGGALMKSDNKKVKKAGNVFSFLSKARKAAAKAQEVSGAVQENME